MKWKKTPEPAPVDGLPGVREPNKQVEPEALLEQWSGKQAAPIGEKEIAGAAELLQKYKSGKASLEERIIQNEQWFRLRHWDVMRRKHNQEHPDRVMPEPSSGWLFDSINSKHADAMDNYPDPVVLPREQSDKENAEVLSEVLPVVMEYNSFEKTYSDGWWDKLISGGTPYGVFWQKDLNGGLGDVAIQEVDLLKLFWEPGVTDLQKSANLFIVELVEEELLDALYPNHRGKMGGGVIDLAQYVYDDAVDLSHKSLVVDWYYKKQQPNGKTILHYVKFVGSELLYASENDPERQADGWYTDGKYPVVMDNLFPEKGTPVGFGYVDICRDPQMYIDKLWANILESSTQGTKRRWFVSQNTDMNEDELLDWNKPIVHVSGEVTEERLREIITKPLDNIYVNVLQLKIDEIKQTSSNRDVNQGSTSSGVTAAAAIAALQEAGNKTSRDMIKGSYRAYTEICEMIVERMRQFYTEKRTFRITNKAGGYDFVDFSNVGIAEQPMAPAYPGQELEPDYVPVFRTPVFDIKIHAQRKNPFSRMEQNERAKELYSMGFFAPERAQESLIALDMMDFEGVDEIREKVRQGQTLLNLVQQMAARMDQMAMVIQGATGLDMGLGGQSAGGSPDARAQKNTGGSPLANGVMQSQMPQTSYMQKTAQNATPKVE